MLMENLLLFFKNYSWFALILGALLEATCLPVPMELISIPVYLSNQKYSLVFFLVLISFSFIGTVIGYHIGKLFYGKFVKKSSTVKHVSEFKKMYDENLKLTIISSAFSPIPYEIYVLSGGLLQVNLKEFLIFSLISRIMRHLPQAVLVWLYGDVFIVYFKRYFTMASAIIFLILTTIIVFRIVKKKNKTEV